MEFEFSIRTALQKSWTIFTGHFWYFIALSAVMLVLSFSSRSKQYPFLVVLLIIASVIWSYVMLSVSLAAIDGKDELLTFKTIKQHLPTVREFFMLVGVGLMTGLFVVLGIIALIIPGIYIMVRLIFANLAYVDRKGGVLQSLRYSWHMVKGPLFWTVLLTLFVSFGLMILGMILLGIGMLFMYPLSMLLMATLYRALTKNHGEQAVIEQPQELSTPIEDVVK